MRTKHRFRRSRGLHRHVERSPAPIAGPIRVTVLATLLALAGCGGKQVAVQPPGLVPELGEGEGLLVIHVETEVPTTYLMLSGYRIDANLPVGRHLWVLRIPEGRYRWTEIGLKDSVRDHIDLREIYRLLRRNDDFVADDEFAIDVRAGSINYGGELLVTSSWKWRSAGWGYWVRHRNHSAMALRRMSDRYGDLIDAFPLRYAGSDRDRFLDYYTETRARLAAGSEGGAR